MITYNHAAFIVQAIESVVSQKVDFPVEVIVADDGSSDGTATSVRALQRQHPGAIELIVQPRNVGCIPNLVTALGACRGQYVAELNGDDYWTSPHKLEQQVAFMDRHPNFSMCFHPALEMFEDGSHRPYVARGRTRKRVYKLKDLSEWKGIYPSTVMIRNGLVDRFPAWFFDLPSGDWARWALLAAHGPAHRLPEPMAVHRIHRGGAWKRMRSDRLAALHSAVTTEKSLIEHFGPDQGRPFLHALCRRYYDLAHFHANHRDRAKASSYLQKSQALCGFYNPRVTPFEPARLLIHLYAPRLMGWQRAAQKRLKAFAKTLLGRDRS